MALLNLIRYQSDTDNIYFLAKDWREVKHQFLLNKHKNVWVKHWDDPKSFIKYSNYMDDIYESIDKYNPNKKRKVLIVLNYIVLGNIFSQKKKQPSANSNKIIYQK